jgi:hypothetical protein
MRLYFAVTWGQEAKKAKKAAEANCQSIFSHMCRIAMCQALAAKKAAHARYMRYSRSLTSLLDEIMPDVRFASCCATQPVHAGCNTPVEIRQMGAKAKHRALSVDVLCFVAFTFCPALAWE